MPPSHAWGPRRVKLFEEVTLELFPESETKFVIKIRPYWFALTRVEGQPARRDITEGEDTFPSKRLESR